MKIAFGEDARVLAGVVMMRCGWSIIFKNHVIHHVSELAIRSHQSSHLIMDMAHAPDSPDVALKTTHLSSTLTHSSALIIDDVRMEAISILTSLVTLV